MAAVAYRQVALAAVAVLAIVAALAVGELAEGSAPQEAARSSVAAPDGGWYEALAAPYRPDGQGRRTACGHRATAAVLGVAHPVLPCGTKLMLSFRGREVLTQVIDRGTGVPGREFEVTSALAKRLGLTGIRPIRWRFAR